MADSIARKAQGFIEARGLKTARGDAENFPRFQHNEAGELTVLSYLIVSEDAIFGVPAHEIEESQAREMAAEDRGRVYDDFVYLPTFVWGMMLEMVLEGQYLEWKASN